MTNVTSVSCPFLLLPLLCMVPQVVEFLSRNFEEPRWRAAAEKNAYRLVQQRRYHLAAAFFILAKKTRVREKESTMLCLSL